MRNLVWILIALSAVGFVIAAIGSLSGWKPLGVGPEACSRASNNLALIGIAVFLVTHKR